MALTLEGMPGANPEPPSAWMFGDSAMRDYEPHLSRVEVVNNLAALSRVIDGLVL